MPATYSAEHLTTKALRRLLDFDPDATSATVVDLDPATSAKTFPIATFKSFLFGIFRSVGTGTVTSARIFACTAADGTGSVTTVVSFGLASAPDAVGDTVWLECNVEQIKEVLASAAYVGLEIALATGTDECVVYAEAAEPLYGPRSGLTSDYVS